MNRELPLHHALFCILIIRYQHIMIMVARSVMRFLLAYYDNLMPKNKNTTQLTCALYKKCHTASEATNPGAGGPGASITDSDGYCLC